MSARTAFHTGIKDLVVPFVFHDRFCWADLPAGSAHQAVIGYEVGHSYLLLGMVLGCQTGLDVFVIVKNNGQRLIMNHAGQLALIKIHQNA